MFKTLISALVLGLFALTGCQDHLSTQDAYTVCQELQSENGSANPPESFNDCVACYETCGNDCAVQATAPATYACPDELGTGGGSADGEGGAGGGG